MKKILAMLLVLSMVMAFAACAGDDASTSSEASKAASDAVSDTSVDASSDASVDASSDASADTSSDASDDGVMTHEEFMAAELESEVCVETYVQGHQSWWKDKITVYCQSEDGAYFLYELACTEEDSAKLVPGTKIRVNGYKAAWEGEVEIIDATFEIIEDAEPYIAEAFDATALLGTEELIDHQNELVSFKGLTVKEISYKNDGGDDIYVTLTYNEADYSFCVEVYLTGTDSEVYTTVGTLKAGDVVDVEAYLYWYQGANPHITAIALAE